MPSREPPLEPRLVATVPECVPPWRHTLDEDSPADEIVSRAGDGCGVVVSSTKRRWHYHRPASQPNRKLSVLQETTPMKARAIVLLDLDYFYCQVEMLRNGLPAERPVAVTQKFLVVTCNYPARSSGVAKLMRTTEAVARCPDLRLIAGEDLTPYREASDEAVQALRAFGPVQRVGLDEFFIDVTAVAEARASAGAWAPGTHVHTAAQGTTTAEALARTGTAYRPMDLRAASSGSGGSNSGGGSSNKSGSDSSSGSGGGSSGSSSGSSSSSNKQ